MHGAGGGVNGDDSARAALLLIGPTGAGKTPIGNYLEAHGIGGRRCFHFDFGANLRAVAAGETGYDLGEADVAFVRRVLTEGALLENEHAPIALDILRGFCRRRGVAPDDWLVMNGLPRHVGQAETVAPLVDVRGVLSLECSPETVAARIRLNTGGDRTHRTDDSPGEIAAKLRTFRARTIPLLDHYRSAGVSIWAFTVGVRTTPQELHGWLEQQIGPRERTE